MKKTSRIFYFLAGLSWPLSGLCAYDEPDMVVTATRSPQEQVYIPAVVTVISREEIAASGAIHLSEVLRGHGGVQLSDLYGDGSRTSISMRGFGNETANANVLILVDGRRLNNPDIADPDLNSVALQDVDRIEIIQGSASVLYGDQAVGGVINIITRRPERLTVDATILSGSYGRRVVTAYGGNSFANGLAFRVSAESREADNYRAHNRTDYSNAFARTDYAYEGGGIFLEVQSVEDELQTPGALFAEELAEDRRQSVADFANDFNKLEHDISRLGLEQTLNKHWNLLAEYADRDTNGEFILSFRGAPANQPNRQERRLGSFSPRLAGRYETANGPLLITLGLDGEESEYFLESQFGTQRSDQRTRSLYMQGVFPVLSAVDLAIGVRNAAVRNKLIDRPVDFLGDPIDGVPDDADLDDELSILGIGLTVEASNSLRHFIRYEENYRFPKVDEHTNSPVVPDFLTGVSDPLDTQTGESTEIGLDWSRDGHSASLVIYRLDLENEISFDPVIFKNVNIESTRREGAVLSAGWQLLRDVKLGLNYSYLETEIRSGDLAGNRVPFTAKNIVSADLDFVIDESWHLYAELHDIGNRLFSGDFTNELPALEGYTAGNVQLDFRRQHWTASLRINNIADKKYSDSGAAAFGPVESFYPAPARNAWFQISYHIE
ncbi:MAG TPA: TonB-dependent receptor [Gammaproteobacteria bacterium]